MNKKAIPAEPGHPYKWNPEYDPTNYGVVRYRLGQHIETLPSPLKEIFISVADDGKVSVGRERDAIDELSESFSEGKISEASFLRKIRMVTQGFLLSRIERLAAGMEPHHKLVEPRILNTTAHILSDYLALNSHWLIKRAVEATKIELDLDKALHELRGYSESRLNSWLLPLQAKFSAKNDSLKLLRKRLEIVRERGYREIESLVSEDISRFASRGVREVSLGPVQKRLEKEIPTHFDELVDEIRTHLRIYGPLDVDGTRSEISDTLTQEIEAYVSWGRKRLYKLYASVGIPELMKDSILDGLHTTLQKKAEVAVADLKEAFKNNKLVEANASSTDSGADRKKYGKKRVSLVVPHGATWKDVHIKFVEGSVVSIEFKGLQKSRRFDCTEMRMSNFHTKGPDAQWKLLEKCSHNDGLVKPDPSKSYGANIKNLQRLSNALKTAIPVQGRPFAIYSRKLRGWKAMFIITPLPYSDEELRTI